MLHANRVCQQNTPCVPCWAAAKTESIGMCKPAPPPERIVDELVLYTVETVVDHRQVKRGKQHKMGA